MRLPGRLSSKRSCGNLEESKPRFSATPAKFGESRGRRQKPGTGLCNMGSAENPDAFLVTFKSVAAGASWNRPVRALWLAPYFTREAFAAYLALSDEQARRSDMVLAAILDPGGPVHGKVPPEI